MERRIRMKLASAMSAVSYQVIKANKADLLYELVDCIDYLERGEYYTMFARSTGADGLSRFVDAARSDSNLCPTYEDALNYAKRTLGVDVVLLFEMNERNTDFKVTITNINLDKHTMWMLKNDLECRGIDIIL